MDPKSIKVYICLYKFWGFSEISNRGGYAIMLQCTLSRENLLNFVNKYNLSFVHKDKLPCYLASQTGRQERRLDKQQATRLTSRPYQFKFDSNHTCLHFYHFKIWSLIISWCPHSNFVDFAYRQPLSPTGKSNLSLLPHCSLRKSRQTTCWGRKITFIIWQCLPWKWLSHCCRKRSSTAFVPNFRWRY